MNTETARRLLDDLAWRVAEQGVELHLGAVRTFSHMALTNGAPAGLVSVLLDSGQPDVVRQRAFGLLAASLSRTLEAGAAPVATVAA